MASAETTVAALLYVAALLLGQRLVGLAAPEAQELGFAIAALVGITAAAIMYYRRHHARAPIQVMLSVGGVLAIAAVVVGLFTQQLWQWMGNPAVALPIAAVGTGLLPLAVFPAVRAAMRDRATLGRTAASGTMVAIAAVGVIVCAAVALALPVAARSSVALVEQQLPGLAISLPANWPIAQRDPLFEYGALKTTEPNSPDHYIKVQWFTSDPVQLDEYAARIAATGQMTVKNREPAFPSSHQAATFTLAAPDDAAHALVTIWNCSQDHRTVWIFTYLSGSLRSVRATHDKIIQSVRCHTGGAKATTRPVFPSFVPPPGFSRDPESPAMLFTGAKGQTIVFDAAVMGRQGLAEANVAPSVVEPLLKELANLQTIETPTLRSVRDLQGHERRVWSATGTTSFGVPLQVEMMVWYCDVKNMTFIGGYATKGKHDVQEAIDALLPAVCHQ